MLSQNTITITGRLTRDPELKYSQAGQAYTKFSFAHNTGKKENGEWVNTAMFLDGTIFGKQAETLADKGKKGMDILVTGRLGQESWTGKDGQPRSKFVITANDARVDSKQAAPANDGPHAVDSVPFDKTDADSDGIPF
jgi:single-strand DNA-binding protein